MNKKALTPRQSIDALRQESMTLLHRYAESTRDMALHTWGDDDRRNRCNQLATFIKRDLVEFKKRLDSIIAKHRAFSDKVLAHPCHPELLKAGGDYMGFIDDATATMNPMIAELTQLLTVDIDALQHAITAQQV